MSIDAIALFTDAVKCTKHSVTQKPKPLPRKSSVVVIFDSTQYIDTVLKLFLDIEPNIQRHGDYLIAIKENSKEANLSAKELSDVLDHFNQSIIAQPFEQEWLATYNTHKNMGIKTIMEQQEITSLDRVPSWLERRCDREAEAAIYEESEMFCEAQSIEYDSKRFVDDWVSYLESNWEGFGNIENIRSMMHKVLTDVQEYSKDLHYFGSTPLGLSQFTDTLEKKTSTFVRSDHSELQSYKAYNKATRTFDKLVHQSRSRNHWETLRKHVVEIMESYDINPKLKGSNGSEMSALHKPQLPFVLFEHSIECNMVFRLSPSELVYSVEHQGISYTKNLAGTIVAYYMEILTIKQMTNLRTALVDASKVLDTQPIWDRFMSLVDDSRATL